MKNIYKVLVLLLIALNSLRVNAQQNIVRGRIIDKDDNTTIIGANIIEYDKENRVINGTTSNINGDFVLNMKDPSDIVKISVIGYQTKEITPNFTSPMTIKIEASNNLINAVTVTAKAKTNTNLTNIDERDVASSTTTINLAEMKDAGISSAADALQGKVAGLDIVSASGDPGSGSQIVIRGLSSIGNSQPLIVIDGVPQFKVSNSNLAGSNAQDISNMINIALQDIKSITVLKDAASTAIYGSQGADGVLLIETYKGRLGKVQFDYQYKGSINFQPPSIPMLNGNEYIMLQLEEWHNSEGVFNIPPEIAYDKDYAGFYNYSANTDWVKAVTQIGYTNDHYFKFSGGGEKTRYYTSFDYVNDVGTTINTGSRRFSTRMNLDYYLSRKLVFGINFNYTNNSIDGNYSVYKGYGDWADPNSYWNVRSMAYIKAPNMSVWEYDAYGKPTGEYFTPINSYQGGGGTYFNPVAVARLGKSDQIFNILENTFRLRYNLLDWLTFRETVTFQYQGRKYNSFIPYNALGTNWLAWTVNKAEEDNSNQTKIRTESTVSFDSPIKNKNHDLTGAASWITDQFYSEGFNIQSNKIASTDIQDPATTAQINYIGNGTRENRTLSGLINLNYKYKDRYMLQTNWRADAFSGFGSNYRWGLFKGVAVAWRFSSEPFMQRFKWLGESKLKASWGVAGRQPPDPYARFAIYNSSTSYLRNSSIVPQQIQLNNLRWESVTSYDFGIELNLFKDRLSIVTDYYNKLSNDLLFEKYDIPTSSGFNQLKALNGGQLENYGWELMMDGKIIRSEKWTWSLNFNTSRNINSFTKLPDNFNTEKSTSIGNGEYPKKVIVGKPIGSFFGFQYLGVYSSNADAVARDAQGSILRDAEGNPIPMTYMGTYTFKGGDAKYRDVNHDGKIDLNDVVYIGDSNPSLIGGFGSVLSYKNFDLSVNLYYRLGFDIINNIALQTEGMNGRDNQSKAVLSRWRVEGQNDPGMLPRAAMNNPANNLGSDRYVERGDFLRLNYIKLGYNLNEKFCKKLKVRNMSFSISARKLFTLTQYSGQDPEISQDATDPFWIGVDNARTPPPQVLTFSVAVGL